MLACCKYRLRFRNSSAAARVRGSISPQYKADPADSHTELQPLIWIYGSAISPSVQDWPRGQSYWIATIDMNIWIGNQFAVQGWPCRQSHWVTTIDMNIWIGNQSPSTRLTPRTAIRSYNHWYEYMDRQSVCSTRLAPRTAPLYFKKWNISSEFL